MISPNVRPVYPRRSIFKRNREKKFDCDMGYLLPIEIQTMYPGDKVRLNMASLIRTNPLVCPPMTSINVYCQAYFVAYRALDENFEDFITGGVDGDNNYTLPTMTPTIPKKGDSTVEGVDYPTLHSTWDYLGFPMHMFNKEKNISDVTQIFKDVDDKNYVSIMKYPFMAIDNIWNEFYRNENLEDEIELGSSAFRLPNKIHWRRDYFTQSLPFQQRGPAPAIPLTGNAPVFFPPNFTDYSSIPVSAYVSPTAISDPQSLNFSSSSWVNSFPTSSISSPNPLRFPLDFSLVNKTESEVSGIINPSGYVRGVTKVLNEDGTTTFSGEIFQREVSGGNTDPLSFSIVNRYLMNQYGILPSTYKSATFDPPGDNSGWQKFSVTLSYDDKYNYVNMPYADLSKVASASVPDLRLAFQASLWMERNARAGVRYSEFIQAHFGTHPTDERLNRPEYIGGCKFPILTNEVLQTSETTETSPQGNLAGRGIGTAGGYIGSYSAKEFGVLVVMMYIKPSSEYSSQGIERQWQSRSKFDFYTPEFAHLSMQGITNSELYLEYRSDFLGDKSINNSIFGYTGRYDDLRYNQSQVCGNLRPDVGNLSHWTLSRSFDSTPTLTQSFIECNPDKRIFAVQNEPEFICDVNIGETWLRPLPKSSEPGYIDHPYY